METDCMSRMSEELRRPRKRTIKDSSGKKNRPTKGLSPGSYSPGEISG